MIITQKSNSHDYTWLWIVYLDIVDDYQLNNPGISYGDLHKTVRKDMTINIGVKLNYPTVCSDFEFEVIDMDKFLVAKLSR